jgi:NAD(P)-dependent dehydrogenase (short-subunit alcohol dehydrogenase family)
MVKTLLELFRLDNRIALITGGAGGFGSVFAQALSSVGADVVLVGRKIDALQSVADAIQKENGTRAMAISADVTDESQVNSAVMRVINEWGRIDILVNNAGMNIRKPTVQFTLEDWRAVMDTNLTGAFLCAKAAAPNMIERKWGRIINISSMIGMVGLGERPAYTAAKGGLIQLTRTLALELAPHNVTANALAPGPFLTEINMPVLNSPVAYQSFIDRLPLGRFGNPEELCGAILFLASDASSFMTGSVLTIDGGWTAQ